MWNWTNKKVFLRLVFVYSCGPATLARIRLTIARVFKDKNGTTDVFLNENIIAATTTTDRQSKTTFRRAEYVEKKYK